MDSLASSRLDSFLIVHTVSPVAVSLDTEQRISCQLAEGLIHWDSLISNFQVSLFDSIPYSQKIWRISQPAAILKSASIKSFLYLAHMKAIVYCECGLCTNSVPGITRLDHFYRLPIFQGSFLISLIVQDNISPMIGVQIL